MNHFYTRLFSSIQLLNELSYRFHLTYKFFPFFNDLFCPESLLIGFLKFFLIKCSNIFFTIKIIDNSMEHHSWPHGTVFLTSLITKSSSGEFGVYLLAKMFSYFDILTWSRTLNIGTLSLISLLGRHVTRNFSGWGGFLK